MVNRVLGDADALRRLFPAEAVARWTREWREHASARPHLGGYATLRQADDEAGRFAETLRILEEATPLDRGLSVAVLVQKNDTAAKLADYLRREGGLPAVAESDLHVGIDSPLACTVLALFRAAAHPGDRAAWRQVEMTPLHAVLVADGTTDADQVATRMLGELQALGFERTVERWVRMLEPALAADDLFSRERGRQLAVAARLFDETGSRDVAEFVQFAARHTVRDAESESVVRVMTVHKAKGLGFDLVILPDLEGTRLAARRRGLAVQRGRDRTVEWVLDLPSEIFHAQDEVLSAHVAAGEADACYEELAVLYVAMTRAKRAMYVVTEPVGTSQSYNFPRLIRDTLGESWAEGDARWFDAIKPVAPAGEGDAGLPTVMAIPVSRRPARTPSETKSSEVPADRLFVLETGAGKGGAVFGRDVHGLLAQVEWGGAAEVMRWGKVWGGTKVAAEALGCLGAPELNTVWAKPAGGRAEVWRERAFEVVLDGAWVTGVFDRVVLTVDATGKVSTAALYDFKTDRGGPDGVDRALARHAVQVGLYRRVLAALTGLPVNRVSAEVVFTETATLAPLPDGA